MLKKILMFLGVIIVGILALAAAQPSEFRVERSTTIQAPADIIFNQVNDFRKWAAWSPWVKLDPNAKYTFEGAEQGAGAVHTWDGNSNLGAGKMTIIESTPHSAIKIQLDFEKPMKSTNSTDFKFDHQNDVTTVTWSMSGKCNYMCKLMGLFMNMDKMIGTQYEKGLTDIKAISEAAHQATVAPATPATPDGK